MQGRKHLAYAAFKNPSDEGSLSQRHDVGCGMWHEILIWTCLVALQYLFTACGGSIFQLSDAAQISGTWSPIFRKWRKSCRAAVDFGTSCHIDTRQKWTRGFSA